MQGKLIVLEGTDGSGRSAQFRMLCERMEQEGCLFRRLIFPQYQEPSSAPLKTYLNGKFGPRPSDVNPYAASTFYTVGRYASQRKMRGDYYRGDRLTFSDRYTTSNAIHQANKLPKARWEDFFRWLLDLECDKLGLSLPDLVVYLDMPTEQAVHFLRSWEAPTYTRDDIHEVDTDYLALHRKTALRAAGCLGWVKVPCVDRAGALRSIEDIHRGIWTTAARILGQKNRKERRCFAQ